jgi:hypothetical protein
MRRARAGKHNRFVDNTLDIGMFTGGTDNVNRHNDCTTSEPASVCS